MATHLLDTSALLAHYFDEAGAEEVESLWQALDHRIALCVITLPEFKSRLRHEIADLEEVEQAYRLYADHLTTQVPVDRQVAELAAEIRGVAASRVPLVDAIIAGCARHSDAVLVHRDPHMDAIPAGFVKQLRLPDR